jgi:hypothetical protein
VGSACVQAYLAHLRDAGFTGAPLPFGVDEQGREMLSFVPGDVPRNPLPLPSFLAAGSVNFMYTVEAPACSALSRWPHWRGHRRRCWRRSTLPEW